MFKRLGRGRLRDCIDTRGGNAAVVSHRPKKEIGFAISGTHSNHLSFEVTAVLRISSWPRPDAQQAAPGSRTGPNRPLEGKSGAIQGHRIGRRRREAPFVKTTRLCRGSWLFLGI